MIYVLLLLSVSIWVGRMSVTHHFPYKHTHTHTKDQWEDKSLFLLQISLMIYSWCIGFRNFLAHTITESFVPISTSILSFLQNWGRKRTSCLICFSTLVCEISTLELWGTCLFFFGLSVSFLLFQSRRKCL